MLSNNKKGLVQQGLFCTDNPYEIQILKPEHIDEVVDLFTKTFCEYEPMTHYLGMLDAEFRVFAQKVIRKAAQDGLSVVVHDEKNIVACAIVEDIANPLSLELAELDKKFHYIFGLLETLSAHFFEKKMFKQNNLAHLFITAVNVNARGCGLSKAVNLAAMKLAKKKGFEVMCCEFTNNLNEKGTLRFIEQEKVLIGTCCYKDFVMDEMRPFEHLAGHANAYLWELRPDAKLTYHVKHDDDQIICRRFTEEFKDRLDTFRQLRIN